jgi:periplasmic divalent cation tolerance protein
MDHVRVAFVTIPRDDARQLARNLVEARLAACVNIVPKIESVFWWNGKVQEAEEALLVVKTTQLKVEALISFVREHHPNDVPEILTFKLSEGLPDYLNYVIDEMGKEVV